MSTLAERILGAPAGSYVDRVVDRAYVHDGTGVLTHQAWQEMGSRLGMDPARITIIFDHIVPANTSLTAELQRDLRLFAREHGIPFVEAGGGICHQRMAEDRVLPGEVIVGADSHTCTLGAFGAFATGIGATDMAAVWTSGETWFRVPGSVEVRLTGSLPPVTEAKDLGLAIISSLGMDGASYRALEFVGDTTGLLSMPERMTIANLAVESGAKTGLFYADAVTNAFLEEKGRRGRHQIPEEADYEGSVTIDCSGLESLVAVPPRVDTVRPASELAGLPIDQVLVGTCTNGRAEDLARFARIVRGKQVKVRTVVVPASAAVLREALMNGDAETLVSAGCMIGVPGCGPCLGAHMGVIGEGEVCLSTANRNFRNRMGVGGEIYLSSVTTAAWSALAGEIAVPEAVR